MKFSFEEGSEERYQYGEFKCIHGFEDAGCRFRTGMFYTGRFNESGAWEYILDDSMIKWNAEGKDLEQHFQRRNGPLTKTAIRMDRLFNEFLYLASHYGFLQEWNKSEGYAIISTHNRMHRKLGLPGYLERQRFQNLSLDMLRPHLDFPEEFSLAVNEKLTDANRILYNHALCLEVCRYSHHTEATVYEPQGHYKQRTFPGEVGVKLNDQGGKAILSFYLKSFGATASKDKSLNMDEVCVWIKAASELIDSLNALEIDLNA